jgi:pilus assembly protein CpaB
MKRPAVLGAVAVVLFLFTTASLRSYLKNVGSGAPAAPAIASTSVVVATELLPLGIALEPQHMRAIPWPGDGVPVGAFSDPGAIVGWVTRSSFVPNEPFLPDKLANPQTPGVLPLMIPPGMRATSVRVNEVTGISGFVTPGSKVDVIATMASEQAEGGKEAFTLLENVEVLAIAQTMEQRDNKPTLANTVTLLVSPEEAERVTLAGNEGTLQLVLRNFQDRDPANTNGVSLARLSFHRPEAVAADDSTEVELIRGADRVQHRF